MRSSIRACTAHKESQVLYTAGLNPCVSYAHRALLQLYLILFLLLILAAPTNCSQGMHTSSDTVMLRSFSFLVMRC